MSSPPPDPYQPITDLIFGWAACEPDKTVMVYNGEPMSYRVFAQNIAVARSYFARRGYGGAGVAVLAVRNLKDVWILSFALRSLGLTTIALPDVEAVARMGVPDVRCVVTSPTEDWPGLPELCASQRVALLSASLDGEASLALDAIAPPAKPGGHILLTSGTTGLYKMVLFDPSFEPDFINRRQRSGVTMRDSVYNLFDFPAWTGGGYKVTVKALASGATVVIDQRSDRREAMLYPGVTHSMIIPGMLDSLLADRPSDLPPNDKLRLSVTGGGLSQKQIDLIRTRITPNLYSAYGATETGPIGSTLLEHPGDLLWHNLVCEVQLVDDADRPVPMGEVGRVRVSTEYGPTGYLNDEEATRAFFKDGYFYTGDLGVMRSDGRMALQGRVTDVINWAGIKISPAPIEDDLRNALSVSGVCLFSMQDAAGEEEIHVIVESSFAIDVGRLGEVLRRTLPVYPRVRVHYTTALPRNAMGKVLRLAAREQALTAMQASA